MQRRILLKASQALTSLDLPAIPASAKSPIASGASQPFSFDWLKRKANKMARTDYQSPTEKLPDALANLTPLNYQKIAYDWQEGLRSSNPKVALRVHFCHADMHFNTPARMHDVDPGRPEVHEAASFWAQAISARSTRTSSTGCRRRAWRSTPMSPAMRNFPTSHRSGAVAPTTAPRR